MAFSLFLAITYDFAKIKYENKENHIADELKILKHYNHISPWSRQHNSELTFPH